MNRSIYHVAIVCVTAFWLQHAGAEVPFNPRPSAVQTPLQPGGPEAALLRLSENSDGKTPVVKEFQRDWVRSLAERGAPTVYTHDDLPVTVEEILFENFENGTFDGWTVVGEAFGTGPNPNFHHQPLAGHQGHHLADSFHNQGRVGADAHASDRPKGKLTSKPFRIERRTIKFLIGGGNHSGKTCLNLIVDDEVVRSAIGRNSETLTWTGFDVRALEGENARIEIVDDYSGGWGHVMVDQIVFTDESVDHSNTPLDSRRDCGSMVAGGCRCR
jgi:hypothetical protein